MSKCACSHDEHNTHEHSHQHTHTHADRSGKEVFFLIGSGILLAVSYLPFLAPIRVWMMLAAVLLAGYEVFLDGIRSVVKLKIDETTLLSIAVVSAFVLGEYAEAVVVTILFSLGLMLEHRVVEKGKREIEALIQIRPETATVIQNGELIEQKAEEIPVGSILMIKAGEKIPLDCAVLEGSSTIDSSALTGESIPRETEPGITLLSGSLNLTGSLRCRTVSRFEDSAASRMIEMVRESAAKKGQTEAFITRFAKIYTPIVVLLSLVLAVLPPLLGFGGWEMWISRALVFLVASCPCALVISIPLTFFAAIGGISKNGVLIKGTKYLERLARLDCAVFDKTGTLTTGKLSVTEIHTSASVSREEVLRLAALAESHSSHPIAQAVVRYAGTFDMSDSGNIQNVQEHAGRGVTLSLCDDQILCGSQRLMEENGISVQSLPACNLYLAKNTQAIGGIVLADDVRADAKGVLDFLKQSGVKKTVMLTGDGNVPATRVQSLCGADEVYSQLLPKDKVDHLERLKQQNGVTLFVGDGINDAPVLACSDVGVALGFGTDAAIEAADVVLLSDRLSSLSDAVTLSKRTMSVARFNILFALTFKAAVLILGASGHAGMAAAIVADMGVTLLSVLNATRLLRVKKH